MADVRPSSADRVTAGLASSWGGRACSPYWPSAPSSSDSALGLTGRHATSEVLPEAGFTFRHPTLDKALGDLLPH
ncbi:DUF1731 domain-containing protein [Nocardia sp. CY41]|uniref:DUF1731 domain-containing protein n=1 Tax=Nocardia sp. CY41 TaxID=2608686 RepID=UPI001F393B5A|nr:DUF1731 domain-containing protein [Nocardia sp. CY41]